VSKAITALGGNVESVYFCFGTHDVVVIVEAPDNVSAAALSVTVGATGLVRINSTPLLNVEEMDRALAKTVDYRPPGK